MRGDHSEKGHLCPSGGDEAVQAGGAQYRRPLVHCAGSGTDAFPLWC